MVPNVRFVWKPPITKIDEIDPDELYTSSSLYSIDMGGGLRSNQAILEAKKSGVLPFIQKGVAQMIKGSDAIALLSGKIDEIGAHRELAIAQLRTLSDDDIISQLQLKIRISAKNASLTRENKILRSENRRLLGEVDSLKSLLIKKTDREKARLDTLVTEIRELIFKGEQLFTVDADFIQVCGVYFLIENGIVVYVGQSVNVFARVGQHKSDGKKFDEVRYFRCDKDDLDEKEMFFIKLLQPELNGRYKYSKHPLIEKFCIS